MKEVANINIKDIYQNQIFSLLYRAVVEVGLLPVNMTITENATFPVCVQLTNGILGRDIIIPLVVESGSAVGETIDLYDQSFHYH